MAITKKSKVAKKKWSVVAVGLCLGLAFLSLHLKYRDASNEVGSQEIGSFDVQEFFNINSWG
ncbi:hypothetical protein [Vibrio chagasii]|uniref:hypothetical protein n=1 Tax=Vibrio chagasii TaxID=170679 RepID=UPI002284F345|nr:hypothetical protein [Vibrio chagasii]MCY9824546.1 hypothetical protein [Vibrio chagasii]